MSKANFNNIINRRGTGSYKWDSAEGDVLPLWVADMDFQVAPAIRKAVEQRAQHGIFGYTRVAEDYYLAVIQWFRRRHHWPIKAEWILYTSGVVPALSATLRALTQPGDGVLMLTPVYNCFYSSIRNQDLRTIACPLVIGEDNKYHIDFQLLERCIQNEKPRVFLLCNPHNPGGRVWTREELQQLLDICLRYKVQIVSDEIHGELVLSGHQYIPMASISKQAQQHVITLTSSSKAFNTAGLQMANIICADAEKRTQIDKVINIFEICDVNPFGPLATIAAYNESEDWLDSLNKYIEQNYTLLTHWMADHCPTLSVMPMEGTYLAWVDINSTGISAEQLCDKLKEHYQLWINPGTMYGPEGEGWIRWNLACPTAVLQEALNRFHTWYKNEQN